jgi:hypothetical protein
MHGLAQILKTNFAPAADRQAFTFVRNQIIALQLNLKLQGINRSSGFRVDEG